MIVEETRLPGVVVVRSPVYDDSRGFFSEVYHEGSFRSLNLPTHFAQDSHSRSTRNVLRGIHYQLVNPQGKLVHPAHGIIYDVAVDLRRSSMHFAQWVGVTLAAGDGRQLWIPPGFGHAFLVMSDVADVTYKCTTVHHAASNRAIRWNDPTIGVHWPLEAGCLPILSEKDANAGDLTVDNAFE